MTYNKESVQKYFKSENGREHLKEAQKNYRKTETGRKKNSDIALRWYYKQKEFKSEFNRLSQIQLETF